MCEIGQKPLPLRSRPFFGSRHPQRIRNVRQRIRREPRARARASSTRARGSRASRPGRRCTADAPRAPDRRSRRADRAAWITNNGRQIDSRKAWKTSHSRAATAGEQRRQNRRSRITDHGSRITYSEHRSRARGSWITSQAQPGQQISRTTGARAWRSTTSSYPGTPARIYQARTRAARPTIQASPGELPPGKKKGLRRALS